MARDLSEGVSLHSINPNGLSYLNQEKTEAKV